MNAALHRRLAAVEVKLLPKVSPHLLRLLEIQSFCGLLDSHGVTVEALQRNGLGALPRALVDRLKMSVTTV